MYKKIIILISCICCIITSCDTPQPLPKEMPPTPVTAVLPEVRDVSLYIDAVGMLEPSYFVEIRSEINGAIEEILVKEGQMVKLDDPLFKIDSKHQEISVKEAAAQLEMDHAAYAAAQKKKERFYSLAQKDLIAQIEWDEIEMDARKAKAMVDFDSAKLEAAQLELEECTIRAPGEGTIGRYDVHPGSLVSQEHILTTLTRSDPLMVNFSLTEKDFGKISHLASDDLTFEIELLCGQECSGEGKLVFLDHHFDEKSGMLFLRGVLNNADQQFRSGQSVRVRVPFAVEKNRVIIPHRAIKYNQQGPYVYVVSPESTLEFRQLVLGGEEGHDEIVILEGLDSTEQVVTSSQRTYSPGLKVEVQP